MTSNRRIYALDTNVLMHDPTALFKFEEHDVFLPMTVLEELDASKKGMSEASRNARQVSRFINELIEADGADGIATGLRLRRPEGLQLRAADHTGVLLFQTQVPDATRNFGKVAPDNQILSAILALRAEHMDRDVVLVSKDINLRIKAHIAGLPAEDYENDRALDDFNLLYTGAAALPQDFWDRHERELRSWTERGHNFYEVERLPEEDWHPNQFLYLPGEEELEFRVAQADGSRAVLQVIDDYASQGHQVWGISARNREQNFALNALMNPDIDFVTLLGTAGTGKTLLALAAGLAQTMDQQRYREIIMTRATVSVGEDIGFLPGTEEEKMTPWMGALTDNLEVLTHTPQEGGAWGRAATNDLLSSRIKIRAMNFMRGRTFLSRFVIIDEAQNLSPKQMKTLLTRAGPGTKMVCLGNVEQIDTPYLTETTSGLTYAVDRFKHWPHSAHITLRRGERSRLADFASEAL
ncbi:MAG: PhoH family protein [Chiayiivirga sp.]|jgi:PhoH-like ATPase|uniref:PhoH family protein n=1 Tax=Denitratimonas tolerans TaxID=1338420 RepID=A0AAW9RAL4_9GAMM|nr:PhoH family protein [Xanthomonadaceae bacterium]MDX9764939.1 PhoH family protein [Chiayiivirga sp.]MEB2315423.1 PhoH family protein [Xanthomonadaceae bacterium]HMN35447.1 PhoH family protein [Chiayiivirga sp.]